MEEGLTDESSVDVQIQELKNLLGMVRGLDEGSFVDKTHFERSRVVTRARLKTEFDRRTMVRRKGLSATSGLYTKDGRSGTSAIHAVPLTLRGVSCVREGGIHQWLNLIPLGDDDRVRPQPPQRLAREIT